MTTAAHAAEFVTGFSAWFAASVLALRVLTHRMRAADVEISRYARMPA